MYAYCIKTKLGTPKSALLGTIFFSSCAFNVLKEIFRNHHKLFAKRYAKMINS